MIFLVGTQRSGTLWLQRILAAHPDVVMLPSETHLFNEGIGRLGQSVHHGPMTSTGTGEIYMDPEAFYDATRDFCDAVFGQVAERLAPTAQHIVERSPNHVYWLDVIGPVYPDGRFVHIIRDGRDVARSQVSQHYGPDDVGKAAREWRRAIDSARAAAPRLRSYTEVRYEKLLAEPRAEIGALFRALGLDDEAGIDVAVEESGVLRNVDLGDARVGVGKWRDTWSAADHDAFLEAVGDELSREFGFEPDPDLKAHRRRRLQPRRTKRSAPTAAQSMHKTLGQTTYIVDHFLTDLVADRPGLADRVTQDLSVYVYDSSGERTAAGDGALDLLREVVRDDAVGWNHQVFGTVYVGLPNLTVVLTHADEAGNTADRTLIIRTAGGRVDLVRLFCFPLHAGAAAGG
jgi:hypothetical protein